MSKRMMRGVVALLILLGLEGLFSCASVASLPQTNAVCTGYSAPSSSPYVLPFPLKSSYVMSQGNCGGYSHGGNSRYSYDFLMKIGSPVVAARAGKVIGVENRHRDYNGGIESNYVFVEHEDGTIAQYFHLTRQGALVKLGDTVVQGQLIGLSGNTGYSTEPHLHFEVRRSRRDEQSVPVTFRNASPQEAVALTPGRSYTAN